MNLPSWVLAVTAALLLLWPALFYLPPRPAPGPFELLAARRMIEGEIAADGRFARGALRLDLPLGPVAPGRSVTLGLRPEDVAAPAPGRSF